MKSPVFTGAATALITPLDENGIDYMPLKGACLKLIYPQPELRLMGDADILIKNGRFSTLYIIPTHHEYDLLVREMSSGSVDNIGMSIMKRIQFCDNSNMLHGSLHSNSLF